MILRVLIVLALAIAGVLKAPFMPLALTSVPAHELFFSLIGAVQLMAALALLVQPRAAARWAGMIGAGTGFMVTLMAALVEVPFTNVGLMWPPALLAAFIAEGVAFGLLLVHVPGEGVQRAVLPARALAVLAVSGAVYAGALLAEPHYPDLVHDVTDHFATFEIPDVPTDYVWDLPAGFPLPPVPEDNPMTVEKVELGRYLFYDKRLSGNGTMSCASCHSQELAFTDGVDVPVGSTGETHVRNSQTLANIAYNASYTWGNPVLAEIEDQVVIPLFGEFPVEMGVTGNEAEVIARLREDTIYPYLFAAAYLDADDPYTFENVVDALSSFTRSMISANSRYDQFVYGGDMDALTEAELRGMALFLSETLECHHCHVGFNFSLSTRHAGTTFLEMPFFNTGLYNVDDEGAYPRGNTGVYEITGTPEDMGRFRPPTLRNIELTAPYMHDGSIATLEEVIDHYAAGGRNVIAGRYAGDGRVNPYKSGFVSGFEVTEQEKADLVAFLRSLTDEQFITDPRYSNPFEDISEQLARGD